MAVTKKLTGEVVMMNILTGLLKLKDEKGIEHKIQIAGKYLRGIDLGNKVEVEIRKGKARSITRIPEVQIVHSEPTDEIISEVEKSKFGGGNSQ
jgi:hypothetical protein